MFSRSSDFFFFFFNDTATTEIYTLSLHDALPISPYAPLIPEWGHIAPCFCYHCPFNKTFPECELACAEDLETFVREHQTETAAGLIFEPVVGATLGAAVPPEGYVAHIAATCRRNGILLIADEVMTGMGRTGKPFATQHWGVDPDIILIG